MVNVSSASLSEIILPLSPQRRFCSGYNRDTVLQWIGSRHRAQIGHANWQGDDSCAPRRKRHHCRRWTFPSLHWATVLFSCLRREGDCSGFHGDMCYSCLDYDTELKSTAHIDKEKTYELPDKNRLHHYWRHTFPLRWGVVPAKISLVKEQADSTTISLQDVMMCDVCIRKELHVNVVLLVGTTISFQSVMKWDVLREFLNLHPEFFSRCHWWQRACGAWFSVQMTAEDPGGCSNSRNFFLTSNASAMRKCCSSQAFSLRFPRNLFPELCDMQCWHPQEFVRQYRVVKQHDHVPMYFCARDEGTDDVMTFQRSSVCVFSQNCCFLTAFLLLLLGESPWLSKLFSFSFLFWKRRVWDIVTSLPSLCLSYHVSRNILTVMELKSRSILCRKTGLSPGWLSAGVLTNTSRSLSWITQSPFIYDQASSSTGKLVAMRQWTELLSASSSSLTVQIKQRNWKDFPSAPKNNDDHCYNISIIMSRILRHSDDLRETGGSHSSLSEHDLQHYIPPFPVLPHIPSSLSDVCWILPHWRTLARRPGNQRIISSHLFPPTISRSQPNTTNSRTVWSFGHTKSAQNTCIMVPTNSGPTSHGPRPRWPFLGTACAWSWSPKSPKKSLNSSWTFWRLPTSS